MARGKHRHFVVKCQRSIVTTEESTQLLIYIRSRLRMLQAPLPEEWRKHFGPEDSKEPKDNRFFALVDWPKANKVPKFIHKVPEQGW